MGKIEVSEISTGDRRGRCPHKIYKTMPNDYDRMGNLYSDRVDTKPHNALYERPATLSLLPPLAGLTVLDAGCGNGWYAERFFDAGAGRVVSFDGSPVMVAQTRARVGARAEVCQADLSAPLPFAATGAFDLVVAPLCLHYVADWTAPFAEFHRALRPGGLLVFSTHHPASDFAHHPAKSYFDTCPVSEVWGELGTVHFFRRPLSAITDALGATGFTLDKLLEPLPTLAFRDAHPQVYERLLRHPEFLCIRARASSPPARPDY